MRVLYPLIMVVAMIGLVDAATAADIDTAYLRGSESASPAAPAAAAPQTWSWTGFYLGGQVGAAAGTATFADPSGSSIFGDKVSTPGFLAGGEIGYNWQTPNSNVVLGIEAAANWLTSNGTNTCLAFSGLFVSANCRAQPNMVGDLTARVGWAYGRFNHSLVYVKGGAAFVRDQIDVTTNATPSVGLGPLATSTSLSKVGWTVGAGVEHAITPAWSVKVEYDYIGLGGETVATPQGLVQPISGIGEYNFTPAGTTHVTQNFQEATLGLNYKFGMNPSARWDSAASTSPKAPVFVVAPGWELEVGARDWYSSGTFQKGLSPPALVSRLTYDTTANSGELFGRIEAPWNVFVKGNIGIGSLSGGQLNDEDWAINAGAGPVAYSNTVSSVQGDIAYATLDVGYDFFRGAGYKLGAFVGYNIYKDNKSAYGCSQIANPLSDCAPAIPNSVLSITEDDTWNSLRTGINGQIMITDRLKLEADAAYLPYVQFSGVDNHLDWNPVKVFPEWASSGQGVQFEAILSYAVTDQFSFGVGGRYWAMWTQNGQYTLATESYCSGGCPNWPAEYKTERYGVFVQADYRGIGSLLEGFR